MSNKKSLKVLLTVLTVWFVVWGGGFLTNNLYGGDVDVKLNSANGSTVFAIKDSANADVCTINSNGLIALTGDSPVIRRSVDNSGVELWGASSWERGAYIKAIGDNAAEANSGNIELIISSDTDKLKIMDRQNWTPIAYFFGTGGINFGQDADPGAGRLALGNTNRTIYDDSANYATRFSSNVYIEVDALRDRTVTSGDIIITTGSILNTTYIDPGTAATDLASVNVKVTAVPAVIIASYTGSWKGATNVRLTVQIVEGANVIVKAEYEPEEDAGWWEDAHPISIIGMYRVYSVGTYTIKAQAFENTATTDNGGWNHYLSAFWMGVQ